MIALFSQITFLQPLILVTLLTLPVLWYLLRITPPAPKTIIFPATKFLMGLVSDNNIASKSPWWILLLRLLMAALIIIALARPVINRADEIDGGGAIRLVIDNGWAAAQSWDMQVSAAEEIIKQAGREKRDIYILPTTINTGANTLEQYGVLNSGKAMAILRGLSPNTWPADYDALATYIADNKINKSIHSIWLSHGLDEGNIKLAINALQSQGRISIVSTSEEKLPLLLRPPIKAIGGSPKKNSADIVNIAVDAPSDVANNTPVIVQIIAQDGSIINEQSIKLDIDELPNNVSIEVAESFKNKIARFHIKGAKGAGGVLLLDDNFKKRNIGIAAPSNKDLAAPLIEASYYIDRALEPFANITTGDINALIEAELSVIILPDIAAMPTDTLNALEKWVEDGGVLLRFAGENMAENQGEQFLLPVILRTGGRSLSGALSWDEPQMIATFSQTSPFYGLEIPQDITVKQQVLADPAQDLSGKIWAELEDGTPFITSSAKEKGMIVLIHTSANTSWSDFALSGLYVSVLKRIIRMSGHSHITSKRSYATLNPILIMDTNGNLRQPAPSVEPIQSANLAKLVPSAANPVGIYGQGNMQYALNIGTNLPELKALPELPASVKMSYYDKDYELDIMPAILYFTLILFCLDWLIMMYIAGNASMIFRRFKLASILIIALYSAPAYASEEHDLRLSGGLYLAYVSTGDAAIDNTSQRGLEALSEILKRRTSAEPDGVIGIDPKVSELSFFPLIYWPITSNGAIYSSKAMQNIQYYLDHGGTILFDLRERQNGATSSINTPNAKALRQITSSLNIPPITPIPDDHVLGRSFYLLDEYVGRYSSGSLWVESSSASGRDNVSSVIIGSNDYASAWAAEGSTSRKHEMSMRFGVNLVMYALTGNYKDDQVHIPHILKRLGR